MPDAEEIPSKRCYKCGLTKPLDVFSRRKKAKDGHDNCCKACVAEYYAANAEHIRERSRAYQAAHIEKKREYNRAYHVANREASHERSRAYHAANREASREQNRAYHAANAEARREQNRAWRVANAELRREQNRAWRAANTEAIRATIHRRRARLKGNGGNVTAQELAAKRASQNGLCFYCQMPHDPQALTIDHVIPLRQGGPHITANIVFACGICNSSKGNRTPEQWTDRWYERKK